MSKKQPISTITQETSTTMIEVKGVLKPDVKNMPKGAFKPNKGSK